MLNTPKQRKHLYERTFSKWTKKRKLDTLQLCSIELSLTALKFSNTISDDAYLKLCDKIADVETMIEVAEITFPSLRGEIDKQKKEKLVILKKQTEKLKEAATHTAKAESKKEEASKIPEVVRKNKSFWQRLGF